MVMIDFNNRSQELIRWDVCAAIMAPKAFPTSGRVELPPL